MLLTQHLFAVAVVVIADAAFLCEYSKVPIATHCMSALRPFEASSDSQAFEVSQERTVSPVICA